MPNDDAIAEIESDEVLIASGADVLGVIYSHEERHLVLHKKNIAPAFFDLSTGLAGDVVQKLVNYHCRIAVIGDFAEEESRSLRDFIYESNQRGNMFFVATKEEARARLRQA